MQNYANDVVDALMVSCLLKGVEAVGYYFRVGEHWRLMLQ